MLGSYVALNDVLPSDPSDPLASCTVSLTKRINKYVCISQPHSQGLSSSRPEELLWTGRRETLGTRLCISIRFVWVSCGSCSFCFRLRHLTFTRKAWLPRSLLHHFSSSWRRKTAVSRQRANSRLTANFRMEQQEIMNIKMVNNSSNNRAPCGKVFFYGCLYFG